MLVLCAIGQRGGPALVRRALAVTGGGAADLLLVYVVDTGPREDLGHLPGPWRRGPLASPGRSESLEAAEEAAAQDALAEAEAEARRVNATATVTTRAERGRPEQTLVALAGQLGADLVVIGAREQPDAWPLGQGRPGPPHIGHVARFVTDHAPCDVLLVRSIPLPGRQVV